MKTQLLIILIVLAQLSCEAQNDRNGDINRINGTYKSKTSSEKLELKSDGSYILYSPIGSGHFEIEQCSYSSKGKWCSVDTNLIELTSENYYQRQDGFHYELKKENRLSKDSLYIHVKFPTDFHPVKLGIYFNNEVDKKLFTDSTFIKILKSKYLLRKTSNSVNRNHITFSLNANVTGTTLYKSRILFEIFEEDIDTEQYNYLTINMLNFDLCFFAFEPYDHELVHVKKANQLIWGGKIWEK